MIVSVSIFRKIANYCIFLHITYLRKQIIANKGQESFDDDMNMFLKKKEVFERIVKSKPIFQEIDRDRKRKKEKKKYIKWYEVCSNVTSFKGMMT